MKHCNQIKIYYSDTDSYGVVWHGAYVKWFEIGRVECSRLYGVDFDELSKLNILLPVVELNIRYKSPSKIFDEVLIVTEIKEIKQSSVTFSHTLKNLSNDKVSVIATSTIVATSTDGKLFRKLPTALTDKFNANINEGVCTNV